MKVWRIFKSKLSLIGQLKDAERKIIEREKNNHFKKQLEMKSEYENRIIAESGRAALKRQKEMEEIIGRKDERIRELELEISEMKEVYRNFKIDVQKYEMIADKISTDFQSARIVVNQLSGKFQGIQYDIEQVVKRIDKKDRKLIRDGMS